MLMIVLHLGKEGIVQQPPAPQPPPQTSSAPTPGGNPTGVAADQCNATITHWQDLNDELAIFRIRPDSGVVPPFEAGQFATLGLPRLTPPIDPADQFPPDDVRWKKLVRRAYSIASSPLETSHLEFYIVQVSDGKLTPKLWRMKQGGRLWFDEHIRGEFTLHGVPEGKDLVFISTGTGLAPYVSMLKTYRGTGRWRKCVIIHGARLSRDLGYRDELHRIADEDPSVVYLPSVTREPADSPYRGPRGRIPTLLEDGTYERHVGATIDPARCHIFLCGNPDMINQVEAQMVARGFTLHTKKQAGNLHFERYW
jgi:ferredoxin--NADP+ reductase